MKQFERTGDATSAVEIVSAGNDLVPKLPDNLNEDGSETPQITKTPLEQPIWTADNLLHPIENDLLSPTEQAYIDGQININDIWFNKVLLNRSITI